MPLAYVSTALQAALSSAPGSSGSIQLTSMPGTWPVVYPYKILIEWGTATQEACYVTAVSGTGPYTLTCTRGADGTTGQAHSLGGSVVHGVSAEEFNRTSGVGTDWVNVKDYGATGNGTTVDTTAVQAAVTAALGAGGGTVYFPAGTYVMSNVTFGSNLVIAGAGQGNTVLLLDPASNGTVTTVVVCRVAPASSVTSTSYCHIRDLTIDGNKATWGANTTNRLMGYYLGQSTAGLISHCGMTNVEIRNCLSYAFDIERAQYTTLVNCEAHDNGYASGSGTHINADGFTLIGDDITAVGCRAWNNAVNGFRGGQGAAQWHRVQLLGCEGFTNSGAGASMGADSTPGDYLLNSSITGGAYYSNTLQGIYLEAGATSCAVTSAAAYNNGQNGILVSGASYCSVTGNTVSNNATGGSSNPEIYLAATSLYTTVTGNSVQSANAVNAIAEQSGTDYSLIDGNTVISTGTTISVSGSHSKIGTNQGYTAASAAASPLPSDSGLLWWTGDPEATATATLLALPTAGSLYMHQFMLGGNQTLTGLVSYIATAGSGLTAGRCFAGIYDSTGTLRATTGDLSGAVYTVTTTASSATVTGTGFTAAMIGTQFTIATVGGTYTVSAVGSSTSLTMSTTIPTGVTSQTMTPGANYSWLSTGAIKPLFAATYAAAAGRYYAAYMFNGTTAPAFKGPTAISSAVNAGLAASFFRVALSSSTGNTTALPSTITLSGNVGNSTSYGVWTAGF